MSEGGKPTKKELLGHPDGLQLRIMPWGLAADRR